MSSYTGKEAEQKAAEYLRKQGYSVLDQNWRTRYCEIDIVVRKKKTIYFVEVKFRKNTNFGHGLDYITPSKLKQMQFAAEMWVQSHDWQHDYQLSAISIDADKLTFIDLIEL